MTDSSRVAGRLRCSESARFIFTVVNFDSEFNDKWSITTFSTYPIIATPLSNGQEGGGQLPGNICISRFREIH